MCVVGNAFGYGGQCPPYKGSIARDFLWELYRDWLSHSLFGRLIGHCSLSRSLDLFVRLIPIYTTELFRIPLAFLSVII